MYLLTLDFGTSSVKLALLNTNFEIIEATTVPYQYHVYHQDFAELDCDQVLAAMLNGLKKFDRYYDQIEAIGYDTFSPSVLFIDENGKPLYPIIIHLDRRSKEQTRQIIDTIGKDNFQSITGVQPFTGGVSATTILWMKQNEPQIFAKTRHICHLNSYLYYRLTGVWGIDPTNASMTGLYETTKGHTWSKELCQALGIPIDKLPPLIRAGEMAGFISKEFAALTGIKEGVPVAFGSNDVATALYGLGCEKAGDVLITSGSSEMISVISDRPLIDDHYYLREAITPNRWQVFAITTSGFAIDWFYQEFYRDMSKEQFFQQELPRVIDGVTDRTQVRFSPYLAGDRQSLMPKQGAFSGLTLATKREDLLAAILLGFHEPILSVLHLCETFLSVSNPIMLTGGMCNKPMLELKEKLFAGYRFEIKENGPLIGCARLALNALKQKIDKNIRIND